MGVEIDRRAWLKASAGIAGTILGSAGRAWAFDRRKSDVTALGAVDAVAAMRRGDLRAETYAQALLAQAERFRSLNAFRTLVPEKVLEAAKAADRRRDAGVPLGRLHGLPIPVKDSVDTSDLPTSNGTRALETFRPARNAEIVTRLSAEGALVMGKTNLHELSFGWTAANESFGDVRNAYDASRSPGGSSGGSASAVAAHMAPLAVAEDTWASIRLPAAFSGLVGLRPTYGRYPDTGIMPLTTMFDQVGPLARSVEDVILFDTVAAADPRPVTPAALAISRIGIPNGFFWDGLAPGVERVARQALARLREAGLKIEDVVAGDMIRATPQIAKTVIAYEARDSISGFLKRSGAPVSFDEMFQTVGPNLKSVFAGMALPPARPSRDAYDEALAQRAKLKVEAQRLFAEAGILALVFPVATTAPPPISEGQKPSPARNTALGSCLGMASLVLPAGLDDEGLPVGLEFAALPGRDRALLALGLSLERALGPIAPPKIVAAG